MNTLKTYLPIMFVLGLAMAGGAALAKPSEASENDAVLGLAAAKITLVQAIAAAESHVNGRATSAELESEGGTVLFEVEVVDSSDAVYDVVVDAGTGEVLSSKADAADDEQEDDEEIDD